MIDLGLLSDISRDVAMATNFVKNDKLPSFVALAFRNGIGYCYLNLRINSVNDASISCKNFVNLVHNSRVDRAHLWTSGTTLQNTGVFSWISQYIGLLDRYSQYFHHIKALFVLMINLNLIFREKQESDECVPILPTFFALAFENELQYHYPYVRVNSSDNQATSDINLAGF